MKYEVIRMNTAICYSFSFLVEGIMLWQYTYNLFISKNSKKRQIKTLIVLYFALFIASLLEQTLLNTVVFLLANFIFFTTQCILKWYIALFHSVIITAIMGMCELIVYGIILQFSPHFFDKSSHFYNLAILTIASKIIYFATMYILIHFFKGRQKSNLQHDKSILILIWIPATSIFVMLTFINIGETVTFSLSSHWMITLSAFLLLAINLLVFGINQYNQKKNLEFTEMQLLLQKESDAAKYYEMLRLAYENQRILIHDIKKHLHSINMLNEQKDHDKIAAYIQQLIQSSDLKATARLCDNAILNSILSRYGKQCRENNIAFHVDIRSGTTDFISDNDLTSLFCNLLDNAFEACHQLSEAYIEITTTKKKKTPFVIITMINSCRNNPFSKQTGKLLTMKPNKNMHGFGIKSIQKTIRKYHGDMQMYYNEDTGTFHTIITLKQPQTS